MAGSVKDIVTTQMTTATTHIPILGPMSGGHNPTAQPHPPSPTSENSSFSNRDRKLHTRVGTLIVATIYLQLIQNRYMFRSFTVLHFSHQHCVQPVASDVEVVGYL